MKYLANILARWCFVQL